MTEGAAPVKSIPVRKTQPIYQYNSLPRKSSNFQRNAPGRRSAGMGNKLSYN